MNHFLFRWIKGLTDDVCDACSCPTCCDGFKSSSALLQHIESASCAVGQSGQATAATNKLTGGLLF